MPFHFLSCHVTELHSMGFSHCSVSTRACALESVGCEKVVTHGKLYLLMAPFSFPSKIVRSRHHCFVFLSVGIFFVSFLCF